MLASLLLTPGQPVSAQTLIDRLWDDRLPAQPRQNLYTYIARLRERIADTGVKLASRSGGYVLELDDESAIDISLFKVLHAQARAMADSGDHESALGLHRTAARLWGGEPLADLSGDWAVRVRTALERDLLAVAHERCELELRLGHHAELLAELSDLVGRYPFDENLVEHLMLSLYRCGRTTDALQAYQDASRRLLKEYGADLRPTLRELYQRIAQNDPTLLRSSIERVMESQPLNTLPRDVRTFTGRRQEIEQVLEALNPRPQSPDHSQTTVISIDGMGGVGKSTLALHLAHMLTTAYPDAQLFLDLHGNDLGQPPSDPATALDTLLRVTGISHQEIPRALDDRAALWRSRLAQRQALLVFDDAAGYDQIRPLLPGTPRCLVIVTSRRKLTGLHDALPVSLGVLSDEDAVTLFRRIVQRGRFMEDRDVGQLAERCGHLPLAIEIAGSRLRHRPTWNIAEMLMRLAHDSRRLDELRTEDKEIVTVFEVSYRGLTSEQQAAFRACGLHPGPEITGHAVAALIRSTVIEAERLLDDLLDHHLVTEPTPGRFRLHDLLRAYSTRLAETEISENERQAAIERLLNYYISSTARADRLLYPHRRRLAVPVADPTLTMPNLQTEADARRWLATEHRGLLVATDHAARHGLHRHMALLAHLLTEHLENGGYWNDACRLHEKAVQAWRQLRDSPGLAAALSDLSKVRWRMADHDLALAAAKEALALRRASGDRPGEADLLGLLGRINWHRSDFPTALAWFRETRDIRRGLGDEHGEADALHHIGIALFHIGEYRKALAAFQRSYDIFHQIQDPRGQTMLLNDIADIELRFWHYDRALELYELSAQTSEMSRQHKAIWRNNVGNVLQHTGRESEALGYYRESLETYRDISDRRCQADVLINIGSTLQRLNQRDEALIHLQKALRLARDIGEKFLEARALHHLGKSHETAERYSAALEYHRQALDVALQIKDPYQEARSLDGIGCALLHIEGRPAARRYWQSALGLYERLGVPEANTARERLANPGSP